MFALYDAAMAAIAAAGLAYLLYSGRFAVAYATFLRTLAFGLLAFSIVAAVMAILPTEFPGDALLGLFVLPALYLLVRSEATVDHDTESLESAFELRGRP
jgi:hypothetical protein